MAALKEQAKSQFTQYPTVALLKQLAVHPFDLTKEGNLTPERLNHFVATSAGYTMLYGTERVTDDVMSALFQLAQEAKVMDKMKSMQAGEMLNYIAGFPSEQRSVLHTATRDFFDHPQTSKEAVDAADKAKHEIDKLKAFAAKLDSEQYTDLVSIAIGGSDLGPRANYLALQHLLKQGRRVHFISNVDPDDAAMVMRELDLNKTLVIVVSKTGTTLETLSNEEFVRSLYKQAGLKPEKHFLAVTSEGSPMDDKTRYVESFHMWDWVGGRFSTSSMVGGVMMTFAFGFDVYWDFLRGAHAMDQAALQSEADRNLPLLGALLAVWNHNFLHSATAAIIPYSQALSRYSAHIQQVEMESNGKRTDQQGTTVDFQTCPVIWGEPGTNAQHSFYQLLHQGTEIVPLEFIGFKNSQCQQDHTLQGTTLQEKLLANLFAQAIALAVGQKSDNPNKTFPGNRPSHMLLGKQLTPYALGALLAYYEHKAAFEGFIWGINSFDQEGVQLGKVLAQRIIDRFISGKGKPKGEPFPLADAFMNNLNKLS